MMDPNSGQMVPITPELMEKFANPKADLTPIERKQREWTRFQEGEEIEVKGARFRVHEIGESRLVLKPLAKAS